MGALRNLVLMGIACLMLTACASDKYPYLKPPDLIEQVANSDLSPKEPDYPGRSEGPIAGASGERQFQKFYGTDQRARRRPSLSGIRASRKGYDLNFTNVQLSELAKVILRDTLDISYVFDPRVQGKVTLSTGGSVSREELLALLETVIGMNRGLLVRDGDAYRIVPEASGQKNRSIGIDYISELREFGAGYGISVYPAKHMSSEAMLRMLETFVGRQNSLRASVINNLLIVRGSGKTRQSLVELALMFDVDWMRGQSAGIFTLRNASPRELIPELSDVFAVGGRNKGILRFKTIDRLNALLVITQKSDLLEEVERWVLRLDRDGGEGDDFFVYRIENGKAKELADILNATFSGSGTNPSTRPSEDAEVDPVQSVSVVRDDSASTGDGDGGGGDRSRSDALTSSTLTSSFSTSSASRLGDGEIRIIPDETNNKLLIKAPARIYRKILKVLRRIDKPPLQVLINATLAEVRLNDNLQYGVQFFLQSNKGLGKFLGFSNGPAVDISPSVPGLNFIVGSSIATPRVILDAIAAETAVRVVSSPSVVVLHNQAATLQVGDEVPIATRQVSSVTDSQAPVVNEIQFRDTGVILKVTPRVNSNGLVTMEVEQEISSVVSATTTGDGTTLTPTISQRKIASTIAVQNGQMVILGGLISEQYEKEKSRVPIVRKIPYLGDIVGDTDYGKARTELVVFLQPRVIRKPVDASKVAEELRAKMLSLAPRPAPWDEDAAASPLSSK